MFLRSLLAGWPQRLASIPVEILGLGMVLVAYRYRDVPLEQLPRWLLPWANPEDWTGGYLSHQPGDNCVPKDLRERYAGKWGFYRYHALRNRAHGLRNFDWFTLRLVKGAIGFRTPMYLDWYQNWYIRTRVKPEPGARYWYYAWQGMHIGFKYIRYFKLFDRVYYYECKFGWRITPRDGKHGYRDTSIRWRRGTTPTFQPFHVGRIDE